MRGRHPCLCTRRRPGSRVRSRRSGRGQSRGRRCRTPAAQCGVIGNGPVQAAQAQEAGDHPGGLPERQLEQHLDRQAELDRRVREDRRAPRAPAMRREPGHLLVQPDQQRPALLERMIVAGPVRSAIAGSCGLAHPSRLTAWIHAVNPSQDEFCNNALKQYKALVSRWHFYISNAL